MQLADKQMDFITQEDLDFVLGDHPGPCVSIFMPTHRQGTDIREDPIRFKNLVAEAEHQLEEMGQSASQIEELLKPLRPLIEDNRFWQHQGDGLAVYACQRELRTFRLPVDIEREQTIVNDRFHIAPIAPALSRDGMFYLLALDQGGVRLLQGTRFALGEIDLADTPQSIFEHLRFDDFEKSLQHFVGTGPASGGGDNSAMYHGHGVAGDESSHKAKLIEFFTQLDNGVRRILGGRQIPLVLAGLDTLRGYYREANHYEDLVDQEIEGNPSDMDLKELHKRAVDILDPIFNSERDKHLETYRQFAGRENDRTATGVDRVVPAAVFKRVDTLFIPRGEATWGRFDPESNSVEIHKERQQGDTDLIDLAAAHTLRNGGSVYVFDPDQMPGGSRAAATLW